jgi:hypothetical protein
MKKNPFNTLTFGEDGLYGRKPSSFSTIRYPKNMGIRILSSNDSLVLQKGLDYGLRSTLPDLRLPIGIFP